LLITPENWFLIILAFVFIIGAIISDFKRREVDNIWNFSLIAFALGYRFFYSVYSDNYWFIINGFIGFLIFTIIGNLFYYSKIFAGGDAKLLFGLGTILPFNYNWIINFKIIGTYLILFLFTGSIYAIIWSLFLVFKNKQKFLKNYKKNFEIYKSILISIALLSLGLLIIIIIFSYYFLILVLILMFLFPFLFIYAKSIEDSAMIKSIPASELTVGDWLYNDLIVNGHRIKASFEGVTKKELSLIKKYYNKKVMIKQGIPFTPAFLFSLIILLYLIFRNSLIFY
jgi:Flp pilus assembly protein protease CpaA